MKIPKNDAQIFLGLYKTVLNSVFQMEFNRICAEKDEYVKSRDILYNNLYLIDAYIELEPDLTPEYIKILKDFTTGFRDKFIYIRTLKKHSIFFQPSTNKFYCVLGITNSVDDLVPCEFCLIDTAILNFKTQIVCDGLIKHNNVSLGPNMKKEIKEKYRLAKENNELISYLKTA